MPPLSFTAVTVMLLSAFMPAPAWATSWHLGTEAVWHDNVTNAERPEDLLPGLQWRTELSTGRVHALPGGHRLHVFVGARTEVWPRFQGLNQVAPGLSAAWEYKLGVGMFRPMLVAEGEGEWIAAHERDRGGLAGAGRLQVRQRAGTAWWLSAGHEWRRLDARGRAFDRTGGEWFARVEWAPAAAWTVAAEGRERVGDVVSYSRPPRPDLVAIGKPITFVDTFEQGVPWIAYYFRARTRSGAVELRHQLDKGILTLRHEYRHTLHAGPGYKNRLTSLRFSASF
jgi:hypothetical protein